MKFKLLILLIIIPHLSFAKDSLIPSDLNKDKSTLVNYDKYKNLESLNEFLEGDDFLETKELFSWDPNNKQFVIANYINSLKEAIDLKSIETETTADTQTELAQVKMQYLEYKSSDYYHSTNFAAQKNLNCAITPTLRKVDSNKPNEFSLSNNLRRATKSSQLAAGDIIYIKGKITDINCTPIPNAIVTIWQNDAYGYAYNNQNKDLNFVPTGTAVADNMGNFFFITVFPAVKEIAFDPEGNQSEDIAIQAPHINLSVAHNEFDNINTRMFFPYNEYNDNDAELNSLDQYNRSLLIADLMPVNLNNPQEGFFMSFDLTLNGVSSYRHL